MITFDANLSPEGSPVNIKILLHFTDNKHVIFISNIEYIFFYLRKTCCLLDLTTTPFNPAFFTICIKVFKSNCR